MELRTRTLLCLTLCFFAASVSSAAPKPAAFLRFDAATNKYYVAVKADPPLSGAIQEVTASVYQEGKQVATTVDGPDAFGADFKVAIPDATILKGNFSPLSLAVQRYPIGGGSYSGFAVNVTIDVVASFDRLSGRCVAGFPLLVDFNDQGQSRAYAEQRLNDLFDYMMNTQPTVRVESRTAEKDEPRELQPVKPGITFFRARPGERFYECFILTKDPPTGTFDIKFSYPEDTRLELRRPFLQKDMVLAQHAVTPFSLDEGTVGERALEENLDIGVQFGSKVEDKTIKDESGMDVMVRRRSNVGTLDLRLAPLLNALRVPDPRSTTFHFLTPFLIDARVSTQKINEDTLSLNRIVLGIEYEIRHYTDPSTYPSYQRYIFSLRNASDRDFKQAEWKFGFEFQPVFSALNHPLSFNTRSVKSILDEDPDRERKHFQPNGFGGQLLPLVGFEVGKTWRNQHPFAAIEPTEFVRRFYFGSTLNLDLTAYVRISIKDIFYVRGESREDRKHNYFLSTVEVPFPSFTRDANNSAFFSFERGGQPPFRSADVNALKVGYRLQWNGWFGKQR